MWVSMQCFIRATSSQRQPLLRVKAFTAAGSEQSALCNHGSSSFRTVELFFSGYSSQLCSEFQDELCTQATLLKLSFVFKLTHLFKKLQQMRISFKTVSHSRPVSLFYPVGNITLYLAHFIPSAEIENVPKQFKNTLYKVKTNLQVYV